MNYPKLKNISTILLVILFIMPLVATMMLLVNANEEAQQYAGLSIILIGIYNLPFLLISLIGLLTAGSLYNKSKGKGASISLLISTGCSVIGIIYMFIWGLSL